jgi:hypothetical protein
MGHPCTDPRRTLVPNWIGPALRPELPGEESNDEHLVRLRDVLRRGLLFVFPYRVPCPLDSEDLK